MSFRATALAQTWPRLNGSAGSPRIAVMRSSCVRISMPHIASQRGQLRKWELSVPLLGVIVALPACPAVYGLYG